MAREARLREQLEISLKLGEDLEAALAASRATRHARGKALRAAEITAAEQRRIADANRIAYDAADARARNLAEELASARRSTDDALRRCASADARIDAISKELDAARNSVRQLQFDITGERTRCAAALEVERRNGAAALQAAQRTIATRESDLTMKHEAIVRELHARVDAQLEEYEAEAAMLRADVASRVADTAETAAQLAKLQTEARRCRSIHIDYHLRRRDGFAGIVQDDNSSEHVNSDSDSWDNQRADSLSHVCATAEADAAEACAEAVAAVAKAKEEAASAREDAGAAVLRLKALETSHRGDIVRAVASARGAAAAAANATLERERIAFEHELRRAAAAHATALADAKAEADQRVSDAAAAATARCERQRADAEAILSATAASASEVATTSLQGLVQQLHIAQADAETATRAADELAALSRSARDTLTRQEAAFAASLVTVRQEATEAQAAWEAEVLAAAAEREAKIKAHCDAVCADAVASVATAHRRFDEQRSEWITIESRLRDQIRSLTMALSDARRTVNVGGDDAADSAATKELPRSAGIVDDTSMHNNRAVHIPHLDMTQGGHNGTTRNFTSPLEMRDTIKRLPQAGNSTQEERRPHTPSDAESELAAVSSWQTRVNTARTNTSTSSGRAAVAKERTGPNFHTQHVDVATATSEEALASGSHASQPAMRSVSKIQTPHKRALNASIHDVKVDPVTPLSSERNGGFAETADFVMDVSPSPPHSRIATKASHDQSIRSFVQNQAVSVEHDNHRTVDSERTTGSFMDEHEQLAQEVAHAALLLEACQAVAAEVATIDKAVPKDLKAPLDLLVERLDRAHTTLQRLEAARQSARIPSTAAFLVSVQTAQTAARALLDAANTSGYFVGEEAGGLMAGTDVSARNIVIGGLQAAAQALDGAVASVIEANAAKTAVWSTLSAK